MPRDKRLWMTFPIDMHRHPKITRLSLSARWAFFEMNGEARIQDNDGVFDAVDAEHEWSKKILDQLVASHPSRPLVVRDGGTYRIREFAEHQETREAREARIERNRKNGNKGGRPKKNPVGSESVAAGNPVETEKNPESESESELETDLTTLGQSCPETLSSNQADKTDQLIPALISEIRHELGIDATEDETRHWAAYVIGHAATPPRNPKSYLLGALYKSRDEQADWFAKHRRHLKAVGDG